MQRCLNLLFQCNLFLKFPPFSKVYQATGLNQQNGKQCCLPTFFFMISPKDTSFHISLNLRVLSLSRMLVEVSLTCIFHHVCEKNKFLAFTFLENALNLCIFTYGPVHHLNFQAEFFENLLPPSKNDLLYQNSIRKYEDDLEH